MVALNVQPKSSLMDDLLTIWITDLSPDDKVTLVARLQENGKKFLSFGCYIADSNGKVDVSIHSSVRGTYTGVEPMGLLWSMLPCNSDERKIRLIKRDVTVPYIMDLILYKGHLNATDQESIDNKLLIKSTTFERSYNDEGVRRVEVREGRIRGTLFIPPGRGPFPGVIDLFGSAGGLLEYRAALLASRGFVTLTLAYFAFDSLPDSFINIDLLYFEEAIDWLSGLPAVAGDSVGICGVSLGADIVLGLSTLIRKIKACVCIGASDVMCGVAMSYKDKVWIPDRKAFNMELADYREEGVAFSPCVSGSSEEYKHKIENSDAHFLFIHGEEDENRPSTGCRELVKRLESYGKNNYTVAIYPGAGHLIEPPYTPHCYVSYHRPFAMNLIWGGNARQHSYAQEDSWRKILQFFNCHLPSASRIETKAIESKL